MPRVLSPGVAAVKVRGLLSGQPFTFGFHASDVSSPLNTDGMTNLANDVVNYFTGPAVDAMFSTALTFEHVEVMDLGVAGSTPFSAGFSHGGTDSDQPLPSYVAVRADLQASPGGGLRKPGKIFWPGVTVRTFNGDTMAPDLVPQYLTLTSGLRTKILASLNGHGGNWTPCILSLRHLGAPRPTGVSFPWIAEDIHALPSTQVGRIAGRRKRRA